MSAQDMIFNKETFFDNKLTKITTELIIALDKIVDLIKVQSASDFENIQLQEDEEFSTDVLKDFINIDGFKDDIKNNGLSNKPLNESFYPTPPPSVHDYLDHTDFFIFIRFEGVGKGAMAVIAAIPVTAGTPLAITTETTATPGKGAMAVIAAIPVTAGTLLVATAETITTPETRLNQINLSKNAGNTSGFKVRFYNNVIVIKESDDIDIIALNDKATMLRATMLEISQPVNQILECEEIIYPQ